MRALRRALVTAVASGVLALAGPVAPSSAQILPTTTTAPVTTTTEAEPDDTTTTTEADEAPTTTERSTATTRATATTQGSSGDDADDEGTVEEDVFDEDVRDEGILDDEGDAPLEDDVPAETTSTARDLLVSGDGSDGAESTTTTSTTVVEVAADGGSLDEETQIWLIVAGLVVVALLIGLWTWRYWVRTKPAPAGAADADPTTVFRPG